MLIVSYLFTFDVLLFSVMSKSGNVIVFLKYFHAERGQYKIENTIHLYVYLDGESVYWYVCWLIQEYSKVVLLRVLMVVAKIADFYYYRFSFLSTRSDEKIPTTTSTFVATILRAQTHVLTLSTFSTFAAIAVARKDMYRYSYHKIQKTS